MSDSKNFPQSPVVLCFSAHDATGASGIAADIEAIASQACHANTVVTCLTVQDSQSVSSLIPIDSDIIVQSARAVLEDNRVDAIKIGMTGSDEAVRVIHDILQDYSEIPIILDPMLISSNGMELAEIEVVDAIRELLIPLAAMVTTNATEAAMLIPQADNQAAMVNGLIDAGCDHVLLSGRRDPGDSIINSLYHNYRVIEHFEWSRLEHDYYGSGCTLSASMAALIAQGLDWLSACREAQEYCWHALKYASRYGMGQYQPSRLYWMHEEN